MKKYESICQFFRAFTYQLFRGSVCPFSPEAALYLHFNIAIAISPAVIWNKDLMTPDICLISSKLCHTLANETLPYRRLYEFRDVDHPKQHTLTHYFYLTSEEDLPS